MGSTDHTADKNGAAAEGASETAAPALSAAHFLRFRASLRAIVRSALSDGYPSVERVAARLNLPVRTLQRRLNEQGMTYSDLVEKLRYREACRLLKHTEKPVAAIAAALAYKDPSHFSRAFLRWSGMRPSEYRVSHRSESEDSAPS